LKMRSGPEGRGLDLDTAFETIGALVRQFQQDEPYYLSPAFNEGEARKDFIDKFWIALGWDVNHDRQTNPYEQEVKVERPVVGGGSQRRADYAFYLAPKFHDVRFYVEAKKPYVEIGTKENYFQVIRYSWNSGAPLAVLTDFRELHVVDCRYKPDVGTALKRGLAKYHYTDYSCREKFSQIYWLFSREAVASGSLGKRSEELPKPRGKAVQRGLFPGGYQSIDEAFLAELDEYRKSLAQNLKNHNPELDSETLTELAQRALDRLVFLRFLEDKGIEAQRCVERFGETGTAWEDFIAASRRLDGIYNSIVYRHHDILDGSGLRVDEKTFADICESLAHVNSPYDFNSIPIHILGSIYERFLGKVIVATDKRATVVEKPEVRKAGAVYYTPEYIVRYIVENTVARLISGKKPDQIGKMRFADIACGSGSFLLGVFDLLLNYHGRYYNDNPGKARKGDCIHHDGRLYLSLLKKREILLNNIYGVDIDAQAVEVCQLSLYLRLLQEETEASTHGYLLDFEHVARMKKLLPDLSKNIVCGNSLVGMDILNGKVLATAEERKLAPMDFETAFPEVMGRGGFDAIIGNPPYILLQILEQRYVFDYIAAKYRAAKYKIDTYHVFLERALALAKAGGRVGYITPNSFLRNKHARELRRLILEESNVESLRLFSYQVFSEASVDTSVLILEKTERPNDKHRAAVICSRSPEDTAELQWQPQRIWDEHPENQFSLPGARGSEQLEAKMRAKSILLGEFATAYFGIQTFDRKKFVKPYQVTKQFKPVVDGVHINRYSLQGGSEFVDFCPSAVKSGSNPQVYLQPRIGVRQIGRTPIATFLPARLYTLNTIYNIFFVKPTGYDLHFVLGIVCSKALGWYWLRSFFDQKATFPKIKKDALLAIPIPRIDFSDATNNALHDQLVAKVEAMLDAKEHLAKAKTDKDKTYYGNKCVALDRQIDQLVYQLYDLTDEEIRLVEAGAAQGGPSR